MQKTTYLHKKRKRKFKNNRVLKHRIGLNTILCSFLITFLFTLIGSGISGMFFFSYIQARSELIPEKNEVIKSVSLASKVVDRNGELLMRFHDDESNRDLITQDEITNEIRAAFLAAEDAEFYNHTGVNVSAITRCFLDQIQYGASCGGSTITQQVVKIQTGRDEYTIERKIDEALTALELEQNSTKEEILTQYLNVTPYGSNVVGIKTAAKLYFKIEDMENLSLDQAVTLASLINDPVQLSPMFSDDAKKASERLEERKAYIYNQLNQKIDVLNSQLSQFEGDTVLSTELITTSAALPLQILTVNNNEIKAGHFVTYVLDELQQQNYYKNERSFDLAELRSGGYTIETTLDYNLQVIAEKYAKIGGDSNKNWNVHNAALMTTIPSTGEIITMAGSKNYGGTSEGCGIGNSECKFDPRVNVLTSLQQPGSTNKPLAYLMAFESGILAPGSFIPDIPIQLGGYIPKNWDDSFLGVKNSSAAQMLRSSRNIPALIIITAIGYDNYIDKARSFGYTSYTDYSNYGPSIVLGGADVYPLEHAGAYGVFATGGEYVPLNPIKRILDSSGEVIYEANNTPTRVADEAAVFLLNKTLENLDTGIGESISWDGRPVAGKTGTTENNTESMLLLYSPDFVTIGWAGNNNNDPLNQQFGWPAFVVAPWLKDYMSELSNSSYISKRSAFSKPANVAYGGNGIAQDWYVTNRATNWGIDSNKRYQIIVPSLQKYLDSYLSRAEN